MSYQVDVWAGDLHQEHVGATSFDTWAEAADFMGPLVDAGLLCNTLHSDFKAPPERVRAAEESLLKYLGDRKQG